MPNEIKNRLSPVSPELDVVLEVSDEEEKPESSSWAQRKKK